MTVDLANDWIQTVSGKKVFPLSPKVEDICIEDIAHALSLVCRFVGHTRELYSVGDHSILVSYACEPKDALWGLLHDASEAYLVDVARPVKRSAVMAGYRAAEKRMMEVICQKFGLPMEEPTSVKIADTRMAATEQRDLMPLQKPCAENMGPYLTKIVPRTSTDAEFCFLNRFKRLVKEGYGYTDVRFK